VGRRVDGRTDRHDEAHSSFPQFCERISQLHMDRPGIQGRSRKGGWGGGGRLRGLHERQSPSGGKINILNKRKDFLCSTYFKLRI